MPELPEVETVCRALRRHLTGQCITALDATVRSLRRPLDLPALRAICVGYTVTGLDRRGKYMLVRFSGGGRLLLHLGMTGACRICPAMHPLQPHDRVVWTLADGRSWRLLDSRRFGLVEPLTADASQPAHQALRNLGPDPLELTFDADYLYRVSRDRKRPIKNLIMDQAVVVGIGNIYANEALFRAGIRPARASGRLTRPACRRLTARIKEVLLEAIAVGGTTISDFHSPDGSEGRFRTRLQVYDRSGMPCPRCGASSPIRRSLIAGRSTYFCPRCQT